MNKLLNKALRYAVTLHDGQQRKFNGLPYASHPIAVMELVSGVSHDPNMLVAALLHDALEDTIMDPITLGREFGDDVLHLVHGLTDQASLTAGNRRYRMHLERERLSLTCGRTQTIKVADTIHNTQSILREGNGFTRLYLEESRLLLDGLNRGDFALTHIARSLIARNQALYPYLGEPPVEWVEGDPKTRAARA